MSTAFVGKWKLSSQENVDDYMQAIGKSYTLFVFFPVSLTDFFILSLGVGLAVRYNEKSFILKMSAPELLI